MNLGEKIYRLRTDRNMSQGDLADRLDVSRQSISKWENNSAVPDLDKIVRLSEIFGVTLDELVKGEELPKYVTEKIDVRTIDTSDARMVTGQSGMQTQTIAGILLICLSVVAVFIMPVLLIFVIPLVICGIICLVCKKHIGLKCAWAIYFYLDIYLRYATGINWSVIKLTYIWNAEMNYFRLGFGWGLFLARILMTVVTVMLLRKEMPHTQRKTRNRALIQWGVVVCITGLLAVGSWGYHYLSVHALAYVMNYARAYSMMTGVLDCCRFGFFVAALLNTVRYISCRIKKQEGSGLH